MENSDTIENSNIAVMTIEGNESVEQKIVQLQSDVNVEYAEPNYIYHDLSFNDTYSGNLW
jgi:nucleoside diphosphate kinase